MYLMEHLWWVYPAILLVPIVSLADQSGLPVPPSCQRELDLGFTHRVPCLDLNTSVKDQRGVCLEKYLFHV